jgi:hypothetical protein
MLFSLDVEAVDACPPNSLSHQFQNPKLMKNGYFWQGILVKTITIRISVNTNI